MNLRLAPQALADAKSIKTWWRRNRPAVPDVFEQELNAALECIMQTPSLGSLYEQGDLEAPVRHWGGMNLKGVFTRDRRPKMAAHTLRRL